MIFSIVIPARASQRNILFGVDRERNLTSEIRIGEGAKRSLAGNSTEDREEAEVPRRQRATVSTLCCLLQIAYYL